MAGMATLGLWLGGSVFIALVCAVVVFALWEWRRIVLVMKLPVAGTIAWIAAGVLYIGFACAVLLAFRHIGFSYALLPILLTVLTDTGAYFAGRSFGGPKIAPAISPSKTWSGLAGGMVASGLGAAWWAATFAYHGDWHVGTLASGFAVGAALAVAAQIGDFLESGMKRRAGVKDSGNLIPGHGGILDRVDGMLAVLCVCGIGWIALAPLIA